MARDLSDEVRASLEAVRVAQEAARVRARRETRNARIGLATVMAGLALVAFAFGPRLAREKRARPRTATATPQAKSAALPQPIAPAAVAPAAPAHALVETPAASEAASTPAATQAPAATQDDKGCDTTLIRRAPWRLSPQACARAFGSDPSNGALALAIAHAEQAHGSPAESAQWAERALALDPTLAEAYVLIARAAAKRGRHEDARAAYRRYLELAPRGWHQAEARQLTRNPGRVPSLPR